MSAWSTSANLGDVLWHCHFLMTMGGCHQVFIKPEYIKELEELCAGCPITFHHVDERPSNSLDMWIANGFFEGKGLSFWNQPDIIGFLQSWYNHYGGFCGLPHPVYPSRRDMIWSCQSIQNANIRSTYPDVLIINSPPTSGQCPGYEHGEVCALGEELRANGLYVLFAQWEGCRPYSIAELAKLSIGAKLIIESANGPAFPTHNVWNMDCDRIVLLDPMFLDYGTEKKYFSAPNAERARQYCVELGYLVVGYFEK